MHRKNNGNMETAYECRKDGDEMNVFYEFFVKIHRKTKYFKNVIWIFLSV